MGRAVTECIKAAVKASVRVIKMERKFDPILVQVIKNELDTVNGEMAIVVYRTGHSAMVKVGDFAMAVSDAQGRVVGEGAAPFQIGICMVVLETILEKFRGTWRPGDVIVVNDPYAGVGHMPDLAVVAPAFRATIGWGHIRELASY